MPHQNLATHGKKAWPHELFVRHRQRSAMVQLSLNHQRSMWVRQTTSQEFPRSEGRLAQGMAMALMALKLSALPFCPDADPRERRRPALCIKRLFKVPVV